MKRRTLLGAAAAAPLAHAAIAQPSAARTLRVIPQANLTSLDPFWTTAVVTRNHGFLVYDTLFACDVKGQPRPQMLEGWTVEDDGLRWVMTLREGLKFHDGEPVRSTDALASIRRYCVRDPFGQVMVAAMAEARILDDRRFELRMRKRFPLLPLALGKTNGCFVMPERVAQTDAFQQIRDTTGSGPFRFLRDEWNPGSRAVWAKFNGYVPRQEPVDGLAGGRVPRIDRVEWTIITDSSTAAAAITTGEQDYWEYPLHDLLPRLRRARDVVVDQRLSDGTYGILRFNCLYPPFDNPAIRRAVAMAVDQKDWLTAVAGDDPAGYARCEGIFTCGTPLESEVGSEVLKVRSLDRAKAALAAAGYAGEKVVLLAPGDYPQINALSLVTADLLRRLGMNLELVSTDWGTVVQRRASREPPERGGWSIFHTTSNGADIAVPPINLYVRANGANAWFGWPEDAEIERLRAAWLDATDDAEGKRIADQLNARSMQVMGYIPLGFYWQPSVWRRNVTDLPALNGLSEVAADLMRRVGFNVDLQAMDWGTAVQRRGNRGPVEQGGWSAFCTTWEGLDTSVPGSHQPLRGNGLEGWAGWPTSPRREALREDWFAAASLAEQRGIAEHLQRLVWEEAPFIPLGLLRAPQAWRRSLSGLIRGGPALFWNLRKAA